MHQLNYQVPEGNKLTLPLIVSKIKSETFTTLPSGKVIVCELILENGFSVRGEAAVVDAKNFVQSIGEEIAREEAVNKIWLVEGYLLQEALYQTQV